MNDPTGAIGGVMVKKYLDDAYTHAGGAAAERFYDVWAETYDEELAEAGYVTPRRCATALAAAAEDRARAILDLGCGTGLSGVALRAAGFSTIDGWDPSAEMMRRAEARNAYRVLRQIEPDQPLTAPAGSYAAVVAVGAMGPGLAPPEALGQCLRLLSPGGHLCFSLSDHAIADGAHEAQAKALEAAGAMRLVSREYGDHIRARGIGAEVFVYEKT